MSKHKSSLEEAIIEQLSTAHDLPPKEAVGRAEKMATSMEKRFSTWVRRELTLQQKDERRLHAQVWRKRRATAASDEEHFLRFTLNQRLQHVLLAVACLMLIATGIPLKFHEYFWAKALIDFFGGPDISPIIHRIFASLLIIVGVWHIGYISFTKNGRENFILLLPRPQDILDAWQQIKYFLGLTHDRPRFDKYTYVEKFDYWAVYWGMVVMIGTGLVLWFTNLFLRFMPKWMTDVAKEGHSDEALLATLAIIIWHFYNAHFNPHKFPINKTFISGLISKTEMIEEHPLEYERILAQQNPPAPATESETGNKVQS